MAEIPIFNTLLDSVSKLKLRGGLVGKICYTLIIIGICITCIVCWTKDIWIGLVAVILLIGFCSVFLWRLLNFTEKYPQAALMEGAEFLKHEQLAYGTKANPAFDIAHPQYIEAIPNLREMESTDLRSADTPEASMLPAENIRSGD